MTLALFEVGIDQHGMPGLPRAESGDYTLFDGGVEPQGWQLVAYYDTAPPTITVLVRTSAATMTAIKADAGVLWLADMGSPIHDEDISKAGAQGVNNAVQWLKDHGYSGAAFGAAVSAIAKASRRREFAGLVLEHLHGLNVENVERQHIGG